MEQQTKRRALGKGLEELFNSEQLDFNSFEKQIVESTPKEEIIEVEISELRPNPYQPRKVFDDDKLKELAESIKEHGVFQPIIFKKSIKGYEIIAGERRVRASTIAGLTKIPAIVRNFSDEEMMEIALLENLQRENLNSIEEATAYKKLIDNLSITQEELASKLGKSRSHITNMLGLLSLPEEVKEMINDNKISMSHARVLSKIEEKDKVIDLAKKIVNESLNVREIEDISKSKDIPKKHHIENHRVNEYHYLEEQLCEKLGTKVKVKGKRIEISFVNNNDLNRILEILNLTEK